MKFETQITHSPRQDGRGQIACRLFLSFICPWRGKFSHKNSRHYPNNLQRGIPQGSSISALLSNIFMLEFDTNMKNLSDEIYAYYKRYSDDIIFIGNIADEIKINFEINNFLLNAGKDLKFNKEKGTTTFFLRDEKNDLFFEGDKLQYLGFNYDGRKKLIREQTLSRYWRKVTYGIKSAKLSAFKYKKSNEEKIYKRKIYRKFSHLGKNNFIQYALKSSHYMESVNIRKQIKHHWNIIQNRLKA